MINIFLLFLVFRSSLDVFTNINFYGPLKFNLPSMIGIFVLLGGGLYFVLNRRIKVHRISKIFGVWLLILVLSVFISISNFGIKGFMALREWVRLFTIFMIFLLSYNIVGKENKEKFTTMLFLSLLAPLLVGFYQLFTHTGPVIGGIRRINATFAHPNQFAFYLVLFIGLSCWKMETTGSKFWFFLILLQIVCLLGTFSFSGFVMGSILLYFLFLKGKPKIKFIISSLVILCILLLTSSEQFKIRLERLQKLDIYRIIEEKKTIPGAGSLAWRIVNWYTLISVWKEKPILGYGLNTSSFINPLKASRRVGYAPHNDFLRYLVETGIIGFISYVIFVFFVAFQIWREYKLSSDWKLKRLIFVLFVVFISWQIGSFGGNIITATAFQYYFWAYLGVALKWKKIGEV